MLAMLSSCVLEDPHVCAEHIISIVDARVEARRSSDYVLVRLTGHAKRSLYHGVIGRHELKDYDTSRR